MTSKPARAAERAASPSAVAGIALILAAGIVATGSTALVRHVTETLPVYEVVFFRTAFAALALLPLLLPHGFQVLKTQRFGLHATRAAFQVVAATLFFIAITLSPLAKVVALNFTAPLFTVLLAVLVLGETIRLRRIAALLVGFGGVLVVIRPGMVPTDPGAVFILLSAIANAATVVAIKALARTESSLTQTLYPMLLMIPVTAAMAVPVWQTPDVGQLALLAVIGATAALDNWLVAEACRKADLGVVMPVEFLKLVWAAGLGFAFFAETPEVWTFGGAAMIFGAVVYITLRERRLRAEAAPRQGRG